MIDINNIKLTTPVLELGLSAKLLNRLKLNQINTFKQLMEVDTKKWENVVAAKVISAMRTVQDKYRPQYEKLTKPQNTPEAKQPTNPAPEVSSDPQLDGEAYARMTNTSFAVPSTYDQRRFFVANNILNAYVLSGRLQDEEGPMPLVMREIVKVADAFMDAFDGKPYVEEEDEEEEEEIIIPVPEVETPAPAQKPQQQQKQPQQQKSTNPQKQKKDKSKKQEQQRQDSKRDDQQKPQPQEEEINSEETSQEALPREEVLEQTVDTAPVQENIQVVIDEVIEGPEGVYIPVGQQIVNVPEMTDFDSIPEVTPVEVVPAQEVVPTQTPEQEEEADLHHPNAERGQGIRIVDYLGRGKRGSKYFQPGDLLIVKRMRKGDDGVIVVSATANGKNVCFDSKHYTWVLDQV